MSGFNKLYKMLHIIKIVIVAGYAFSVIHNSVLLIFFKAIQKVFFTVSFDKLSKGVGFYFARENIFCFRTSLYPGILPNYSRNMLYSRNTDSRQARTGQFPILFSWRRLSVVIGYGI